MARAKQSTVTPNQVEIKVPKTLLNLSRSAPLRLVSYDLSNVAKNRDFVVEVVDSDVLPCITVTVPDTWPHIKIAPLYDVHLGSKEMDVAKFIRDIRWMANEPYTLTWNGGDLWDNAIKSSIASSFSNNATPNEQFNVAMDILRMVAPKIMFSIPGNHEQRTARTTDLDVPAIMHDQLGIPYSPDFMACTIKWRGNKFRMLAHHGTGAAASPGGQRNSARKDMTWAHGFDLYWTGHLHQALTDPIMVKTFDQYSDKPIEKEIYCIISPSYLKYFGGYAASKRLAPGGRGLTVVTCQEDGRMSVENRANGRRL